MKSWRTTLFGGVAAASGGLAASEVLPSDARGVAALIATLSGILFAFFSRDKNVSSEEEGAQ